MKKFVIVMLALLIAVPAYAGTVGSKWDVTFGGYIKFDMGWSNQEAGADAITAYRDDRAGGEVRGNKYGNIYMAGGETRINMAIKGPDAWGAKTMGFIEWEYTGDAVRPTAGGTNGGYGSSRLRHAFINLKWANSALTIGQQWQGWGIMPSMKILGNYYGVEIMKGSRDPAIRLDYNFTKEFLGWIGIWSPYKTERLTTANVWSSGTAQFQDFARSQWPFIEGGIDWKSDVCGKIGAFPLWLGFDGYFGKEKNTFANATATAWDDKELNSWAAAFKAYVPIIPEKKGNKTGALSISGVLMTGQNWAGYYGPFIAPAANTAGLGNAEWTSPVGNGYWGQLQYYFTNAVYANLLYHGLKNNFSQRYKQNAANVNNVEASERWTVNLYYDVNPAFTVGAEYSRLKTVYAWYACPANTLPAGTNLSRTGTQDNFRVAAWYFF
jgi:hypothetical protein